VKKAVEKIKKPKKEPKEKKPAKKSAQKASKRATGGGEEQEINFNNKEDLVEDYAVRYQYSWPEWPPKDFDYDKALFELGCRRVDISRWKMEPEVDQNGLRKVFEMEWFQGVFKDSQNNTIDVRPSDTCPSL